MYTLIAVGVNAGQSAIRQIHSSRFAVDAGNVAMMGSFVVLPLCTFCNCRTISLAIMKLCVTRKLEPPLFGTEGEQEGDSRRTKHSGMSAMMGLQLNTLFWNAFRQMESVLSLYST